MHASLDPKTPAPSDSKILTASGSSSTGYTTKKTINETLLTLRAFYQNIHGSLSTLLLGDTFDYDQHNTLYKEKSTQEIKEVNEKKAEVLKLSNSHSNILSDYYIYLRSILEEIEKNDLIGNLNSISANLKAKKLSSSGTESSATPESKTKNLDGSSSPKAFSEVWSSLKAISRIKSELISFSVKFSFVDTEFSKSEFATTFRILEALKLANSFKLYALPSFNEHFSEPSQNTEYTKIKQAVKECHDFVDKELKKDLFSSDPQNLNDRKVNTISKEFKENSSLDSTVAKVRELGVEIDFLLLKIKTEDQYIYLKTPKVKQMLYKEIEAEHARLMAELDNLKIQELKNELTELMSFIETSSKDIRAMHENVIKASKLFEDAKNNRKRVEKTNDF